MLELPTIPGWDALHPLVVHFPVALLLTAPLFILLGLLWKKQRQCILIFAFILVALGTAAVFFAVATGEEAGELVERTAEISPVLSEHSELAETTRTVFSILTVVFAGILFIPRFLKKEIKPLLESLLVTGFLLIYLVCSLILINTAAYGGRLVHELGVRALS